MIYPMSRVDISNIFNGKVVMSLDCCFFTVSAPISFHSFEPEYYNKKYFTVGFHVPICQFSVKYLVCFKNVKININMYNYIKFDVTTSKVTTKIFHEVLVFILRSNREFSLMVNYVKPKLSSGKHTDWKTYAYPYMSWAELNVIIFYNVNFRFIFKSGFNGGYFFCKVYANRNKIFIIVITVNNIANLFKDDLEISAKTTKRFRYYRISCYLPWQRHFVNILYTVKK